jgi:hypothetical protein
VDLHYRVGNPESEARRVVLKLTRNTLPQGWQLQSTPALGETLDVAPHATLDAVLHVAPDGIHGPGGVVTVEERLHRPFPGCWGNCLGGDSTWESEGGYIRTTGGISFAVTAPVSPTAVVLSGLSGSWAGRAIELSWWGRPASGCSFQPSRKGPGEAVFAKLDGMSAPSSGEGTYRFVDRNVTPGRQYAYRVDYVGPQGVVASFGPIEVRAGMPSWLVSPVYPNPSRGQASLDYSIPAESPVWVEVYDVVGRRVVKRNLGLRGPGSHTYAWDARDAQGRPVAAGAYVMRLSAGQSQAQRTVIILR